jgi:branched-chain amino acid transport system substrate-binding protein
MTILKKGSISILVLVMALTLFGACAKEAAPVVPGEEAKGEIIIGILDDFSGPIASVAIPMREAYEDCIRYINEEQGGILGHPLRSIAIDHKMDSAVMMSGWDRLRDESAYQVVGYSLGVAPILGEMAQRDRIPALACMGNIDQLFPKEPGFFFGNVPNIPSLLESGLKFLEKDWDERGETRPAKIGFDVVPLGTTGTQIAKAARIYSEKRGWEYLVARTPMVPADVTTQVLQMKDFNCDYLFLINSTTAHIAWVKELDRQNFRPMLIGGTQIGAEEMWDAVGELAVGIITEQTSVQWTDTDVPLVKLMHELNAKWHPEVKSRSVHYCRGFANFLVEAEATRVAIEKVGYENYSGETMRDAMESIKEFDPGIGVGFYWTPTDHQGLHACIWYAWTEEGILTQVSEWDILDPLPEEQQTGAWWLKD